MSRSTLAPHKLPPVEHTHRMECALLVKGFLCQEHILINAEVPRLVLEIKLGFTSSQRSPPLSFTSAQWEHDPQVRQMIPFAVSNINMCIHSASSSK